MALTGTWIFTQAWNQTPAYKFTATINEANQIAIEGGFFGVADVFPNGYLSLAIAQTNGGSITAYIGNILGNVMGGEMTGTSSSGIVQGIWSAQRVEILDVEEKVYAVGA